MPKKKKDEFEKHACDFKNEEACEEELEEEGLDEGEVEKEHFEEKEDLKSGEAE